jgi:hypothetical protein
VGESRLRLIPSVVKNLLKSCIDLGDSEFGAST